jgi:DNA-directed RNA polymerase specialized sigma24 family protein
MLDAATPDVADRLVDMLKAGELERISQDLARKIRGAASHADDAVCSAVAKILALTDPPAPEKVGSYLYRAALNEMVDQAKRGHRFTEPPTSLYDETDEGIEAQILGELEFQRIRQHVSTWDNTNIRAVTLAVLDAVYHGELLDTDELTQTAGEILGRELSPDSVRSWKSRGLARLEREFLDTDQTADAANQE